MQQFHLSSVPLMCADILHWLPNPHTDPMAAIYELWKERNRRLHDGLTMPPIRIMRFIITSLRDKSSALLSLSHPSSPRLARFWFDPS
ncbi:hypothetical protein Bca52824_072330 [Brassica carinata]|nr:hypothetical protein Bca52824_072330 [Brassica carinata]